MKQRYFSLSAEQAPWSRSGGLAEVAASLPKALQHHWNGQKAHSDRRNDLIEIYCISPLYPCVWREVNRQAQSLSPSLELSLEPLGDQNAQIWTLKDPIANDSKVSLYHIFVDIPWAFDREFLYGGPGQAYHDNPLRFASFCLAALRWIDELNKLDQTNQEEIDTIIHAHDWQSAFLTIYQHEGWGAHTAKTLFTIHNLMHQGLCDAEWLPRLGLDWASFHLNYLEHWGQVNPLKAALISVDCVTTVSPTYATEILSPKFACGLDHFFEGNQLCIQGVLNGLDLENWSPYTSPHLAFHLPEQPSDIELTTWKDCMKQELVPSLYTAQQLNFPPLAVLVSRFDIQKGIDLVLPALETWLEHGGYLYILGSGDPILEQSALEFTRRFPTQCSCKIGFHLSLAHQLFAAADLCIIPSRFEPCGLTQMQAMRYGTLPLATPVGGLKDSIIPLNQSSEMGSQDQGNGFLAFNTSEEALSNALSEAFDLWSDAEAWFEARQRALSTDWSWHQSAGHWTKIIDELINPESLYKA